MVLCSLALSLSSAVVALVAVVGRAHSEVRLEREGRSPNEGVQCHAWSEMCFVNAGSRDS